MLSAGTTTNVIPDYAEMKISLRTYDTALQSAIVENIRKIAEGAAAVQGGSVRFHDETKALPLVNDGEITKRAMCAAEKIVGKENIAKMSQKLSSEDFSFYLSKKPGAFVRLGTRNEEKGCTTLPHNNDFLIDEDALEIGSKVCVQFVVENQNGMTAKL
jgi:metal-dependent amidase/aminoacylase/carboxypeptidase family protein